MTGGKGGGGMLGTRICFVLVTSAAIYPRCDQRTLKDWNLQEHAEGLNRGEDAKSTSYHCAPF